jgi:Tfp pilus assembly protein PilF
MTAIALQERGELAAAERALRALALDEPSYVRARINLAEVLWLQGRNPEAEELFAEAIREPQVSDRGALLYGRFLYDQRRWREADAALRRALAINPDNAQAVRYRVRCALEIGEPKLARELLEVARRLDPGHPHLADLQRRLQQ